MEPQPEKIARPLAGRNGHGATNYELACLAERPPFSGTFLSWGAASIQVITAPSASHAAQMGGSPPPTTGCVGSASSVALPATASRAALWAVAAPPLRPVTSHIMNIQS